MWKLSRGESDGGKIPKKIGGHVKAGVGGRAGGG